MSLGHFNPFEQHSSHPDFDRCPDYANRFVNHLDGPLDRYLHEGDPRLSFRSSHFNLGDQALHSWPSDVKCLRLSSPFSSGSQGSNLSSGWSDHQESPRSSPMSAHPIYPQPIYDEVVPYAYGGSQPFEHHNFQAANVCNLHDIQMCADNNTDMSFAATEPTSLSAYSTDAQEGYEPLQDLDDSVSNGSTCTPPASGTTQPIRVHHVELPVIKRRRPQPRAGRSAVAGNRVSKRPHAARRASSTSTTDRSESTEAVPSTGSRSFPCPLAVYGCNSSFGSKNEWKRHVNKQHMRLGYWRCDQCTNAIGDQRHNDFNRKDLFIQHIRRMHPTESSRSAPSKKVGSKSLQEAVDDVILQEAANRCYKELRAPPEGSQCLFCEQDFHGSNTWDERMEHIGKHMDDAKKGNMDLGHPKDWRVDDLLQAWMVRENIIVPVGHKHWRLGNA